MYPAPLIRIITSSDIDIEVITENLLPILRTSSAQAPFLISERDQKATSHIDDPSVHNRILLLIDNRRSDVFDRNSMDEYQAIAKRSARVFIPIALTCATRTLELQGDEVEDEDAAKTPATLTYGMEKELVLDIGGMTPQDIAGKIARWVWWVGEFMSWENDE